MVNIAIIGSSAAGKTALANKLGKKGTQSDITLYHFTKKDTVYSLIDAEGYPASPKPLITALNLSDTAILCIQPDGIDTHTGECIIACDLLQIPHGTIALTKSDTTNTYEIGELKKQISNITRGTTLEHWDIIPLSTTDYTGMDELREKILQTGEQIKKENQEKNNLPTRVTVDHFFNVTGIGCVVLGVVNQGTLHTRDQLTVYPPGKKTEIRSIQIDDVNHTSAPTGSRVGLALKGIQSREFERGFIISKEEETAPAFNLNCQLTQYTKGFKTGDVLHLYAGLQSTPVKVTKITQNQDEIREITGGEQCTCTVTGEKNIAYTKGDTFILARLDEPKQRILARCTT